MCSPEVSRHHPDGLVLFWFVRWSTGSHQWLIACAPLMNKESLMWLHQTLADLFFWSWILHANLFNHHVIWCFHQASELFYHACQISAHSSRNSLCWMERTVCIHFFTPIISNSRLCCVSRLWLNLKPPSSPSACFIWNAVFRVSGLQCWTSFGTMMDCGNFVFLFVFWLVGFSPQGTRASTAPSSSKIFTFYYIRQLLYHFIFNVICMHLFLLSSRAVMSHLYACN